MTGRSERSSEAVLHRLTTLHSRPVDLSLDRMRRLCHALGNPQRRLAPVVHVAGTNGKGSTIAFLRAMAEASGLRVHVYTSPHLVQFRERVRLAGALVTDDELTGLLERVEDCNEGKPITQFEATTAAALLAFSEVAADLCLVEVGLGGRFDATNVIDRPALSVITPVAHDHCEFLGDTIPEIAFEKAGVIKAGVPTVSSAQDSLARDVIEQVALRARAPLEIAGRDFVIESQGGEMEFRDGLGVLRLPSPGLPGAHQVANAGVAVAAARRLRMSHASIAQGVLNAVWPARLQQITQGPLWRRVKARGAELWLDGAHNPHAIATIVPTLDRLRGESGRPLHIVLGLLESKDAQKILENLRGLQPFRLTVTDFSAASAAKAETLAAFAHDAGLAVETAPSLTAAVELALETLEPAPIIVVCGSLYLAGELLRMAPSAWPS